MNPVGAPTVNGAPNMNGFYHLSETPRSDTSKFPKQYSDYPGGAEYFDVFSPPIVHRYSEVFWTQLPPVPLPPEIVRRFANKTMAVIGFECDQVRWDAAKGMWVPVPINVAYNHHFESQMTGAKSRMVKVGADDPRAAAPTHGGHRRPPASAGGGVWVVEELEKGRTACRRRRPSAAPTAASTASRSTATRRGSRSSSSRPTRGTTRRCRSTPSTARR